MNVLMVHLHDFGTGGGNIAMLRLHRGLRARGVTSRILCGQSVEPDGGRPGESREIPRSPLVRRTEKVLEKVTRPLGLNDLHAVRSFSVPSMDWYREADVVDLHCLHGGFFNYLALPRITSGKGAVMTLHDMWPLTGHCHQSLDCRRWKTGCGKCPYPNVQPKVERDATAINRWLKDRVYRRCQFQVVAPCRWMADVAEESILGDFPISVIPHGVDLDIFRPVGSSRFRSEHGIPDDRIIVLAVGLSRSGWMKGRDLLIEAFDRVPPATRERIVCAYMGHPTPDLQEELPVDTVATGYLDEESAIARTYAAADVFVHPSRAETAPLVLLESLACGTPMVAFDVGGTSEIARPDETGLLAEPEEPGDLARGITRLVEDGELRRRMGRRCREIAEREFDVRLQVNRYLEVYETARSAAGS